MAELLLNVTLIDLGRGCEASTQRVAGEFFRTLGLSEIRAHAGSQCRLLDEACHFLIEQPDGTDILALAGNTPEEGAVRDPRKVEPGLQRNDRAGGRHDTKVANLSDF